tara:strand:- start:65 stop:526 length:462 start_codon:yes stop_codon:yes gene_type:complete
VDENNNDVRSTEILEKYSEKIKELLERNIQHNESNYQSELEFFKSLNNNLLEFYKNYTGDIVSEDIPKNLTYLRIRLEGMIKNYEKRIQEYRDTSFQSVLEAKSTDKHSMDNVPLEVLNFHLEFLKLELKKHDKFTTIIMHLIESIRHDGSRP